MIQKNKEFLIIFYHSLVKSTNFLSYNNNILNPFGSFFEPWPLAASCWTFLLACHLHRLHHLRRRRLSLTPSC